jgi:hypothetical protein
MATVTLQGTIKKIYDTVTRTVGDKDYKTKVFWLEEVKDQYPSVWSLETSGEKTLLLDSNKVGDLVDCKIEIVGRSYTKDGEEKVFNSLKCFGIYKVNGQQQTSAPQQKQQPFPPVEKDLSHLPIGTMSDNEIDNSLPF